MDVLTRSSEVCPANLLPLPASGKEALIADGSGPTSCVSCGKSHRGTCWQRMFRDSLVSNLTALTGCSMSWKRRGTKRCRRSSWVLGMSAPRIDGIGCGSLPDWHTPQASEAERRTYSRTPAQNERGHGGYLTVQVQSAWPTARSRDLLSSEVVRRDWPTATAQDAASSGVKGYPATPTHNVGTTLCDAILGPHVQGSRSTTGKRRARLNPAWVTQLMGFPDGWLGESIGKR